MSKFLEYVAAFGALIFRKGKASVAGLPSVGVGIREYTFSWISGVRVLFSVARSISLTLRPLTSHLSWA